MKGPREGGEGKTWGDPKGQMVSALVSHRRAEDRRAQDGEEGEGQSGMRPPGCVSAEHQLGAPCGAAGHLSCVLNKGRARLALD